MSERTLAAAKKKKFRGLYLDLVDVDAVRPEEADADDAVLPLLYALDVQLDHILAEGIENRWARHEAMLAGPSPTGRGRNGFRSSPRRAPSRRRSRR